MTIQCEKKNKHVFMFPNSNAESIKNSVSFEKKTWAPGELQ